MLKSVSKSRRPLRRVGLAAAAVFILGLDVGAARAADAPPDACEGGTRVLPAGFEAWAPTRAVTPATRAEDLSAARLAPGEAVRSTLAPSQGLSWVATPGKPGAAGSFGGMFEFSAPAAGDYLVGLSAPAWIEVVEAGHLLDSTDHRHSGPCSPVRKVVTFHLGAGDHVLELSAAPGADVAVMIVRKP